TSAPSPASTPADQVGASSAGLAAATTRPSPTRMMIPSLKIDMPVSPQGVDDIGLMALPPDPAEAGWYRFGPAPGDTQGATVIAAHVDSKELGIGPLADLRRLAPGEVIVVLDATGVEHAYRVESVDSVPRAELDLAQLFARTGTHHLNLVTCGGPYLRDRGGYQNNVIARAVPVS
ncbi:class F sortase, partial [Tessaracoccus sp. ZS01]|uniref:class F sortase n=1 Tax=Tessaracoccus sp. ZS01 TaxID=1906324 RepID=UPI00118158E8